MTTFDDAIHNVSDALDTSVDNDAIRFIFVLRGQVAFVQDYESETVWESVAQIRSQNPHANSKEVWIRYLYVEVAAFMMDPRPHLEKLIIMQQCMLINLVVSAYEPMQFKNADMKAVMLLVNPPPGETGWRYYVNDITACRERLQNFLNEPPPPTLQ